MQPAFVIRATRGAVAVTGSLLTHNSETDLRSPATYALELTLTDDRWRTDLLLSDAGREAVRVARRVH